MNKYDNPFYDPNWKKKATNDQAKASIWRSTPKDSIPLFAGRPKRETVIGLDDCLNVQIALETTKNIKEFLEVVA